MVNKCFEMNITSFFYYNFPKVHKQFEANIAKKHVNQNIESLISYGTKEISPEIHKCFELNDTEINVRLFLLVFQYVIRLRKIHVGCTNDLKIIFSVQLFNFQYIVRLEKCRLWLTNVFN